MFSDYFFRYPFRRRKKKSANMYYIFKLLLYYRYILSLKTIYVSTFISIIEKEGQFISFGESLALPGKQQCG